MLARRGFVVSRFFTIYFTITGARKIVISETSLCRSSLNRGSTVCQVSPVYTDVPQTLHHETCNDANCISLYWDHLMFFHHVQTDSIVTRFISFKQRSRNIIITNVIKLLSVVIIQLTVA